jgi:hypothetical protein
MLRHYLLVFTATLFFISRTNGQSILRITEKDQDNKTFINPNNADINSQLVLELDTAQLLKRLGSSGAANALPPEVMTMLETLTAALQKREEWIDRLRNAVAEYASGNRQEVERFNATRQQVALEILSILQKDETLLNYFEQEDPVNPWQQLTNAIMRRIEELQRTVLQSPALGDYRLRIGGWLVRRNGSAPLHFEGLDTNPAGEFYEVERWRFLPTAQQLDQFKQAQNLARTSSEKEVDLAEFLRNRYQQVFSKELDEKVKKGLANLKSAAENKMAELGVPAVREAVLSVGEAGSAFRDLLVDRVQFYTNLKTSPPVSLPVLLATLTADLIRLNEQREKVKVALQTLLRELSALKANLKEKAGELPQLAAAQLKAFSEIVVGRELLDMLSGATRVDDAALVFSDQVLSLSLKELPSQALTDLRSAGYREAGDRVLLRLVISNGDNRVLQESKDLRLYRILPHTETTVGVIFAHPLAPTAIQKDFQMAPYFNLLFKGILGGGQRWKRRSSLPNTLLDLSFGLHISTPDFDKDDVPEIGIGVAGSTLRDYLQFGWAYNLFQGTPYFFLGVRLPVPSLGGNVNATTVDPEVRQ